MNESTVSLAARLAANLFVDAIKLAKPGARLAAKVGDRLLGGSPFNEREAQRFLTMGGAGAFHSDGGPTEWVEPTPTIASAFNRLDTAVAAAAEMFPQHTTRQLDKDFGISKGLPGIVENIAHEFNTMPNWPQSSAPVDRKPADPDSPESAPAPPLPGVGSGHQQPVHAGVTGPGMDVVDPLECNRCGGRVLAEGDWEKLRSDFRSKAINGGEAQHVVLSGREYERYLDGALSDPLPAPFTHGDLAEAARIVRIWSGLNPSTSVESIASFTRLRALADRLDEDAHPDPNP